ncbi:hypothetical protein PoB_004781500 [Plakobranchus ocellatus]|uniref:Uncharacterized protein n=1 Tax=Plakobranchus ocellatus TaxID=259542 RepID=A0AAV4BL97_9GAST|nr:hypothetical protein PoB_004781500 [Plakobranchus ocellatus]
MKTTQAGRNGYGVVWLVADSMVITGFQALRQARGPEVGLEPTKLAIERNHFHRKSKSSVLQGDIMLTKQEVKKRCPSRA